MLGAVTSIEQAAVNGDEGVIVFTAMRDISISFSLEAMGSIVPF